MIRNHLYLVRHLVLLKCLIVLQKGQLILTVDDGPNAIITPKILDLLHNYNIKATFFVVGRTGAADQERMRRIVAEGHTIAAGKLRRLFVEVQAALFAFGQVVKVTPAGIANVRAGDDRSIDYGLGCVLVSGIKKPASRDGFGFLGALALR